MQRGFELGTVTSVDLLNALRDRFQAERELQRARYDHIRADLVLRREAGELTAEDLLRISNLLESSN
jgi:outer membrane protein